MTELWQLAFVDSVATSPTIRLNLHNGTRGPWNMRDVTRFDPPPLRRAVVASLLADGATPTSAAYDNRTIVLRLQLLSNGAQMGADAAAIQLQSLMRELDRPTNILRLQPGTSAPVFFRTYRSGPDAIDYDPVNREVSVSLLAEPFALGLEEVLAAATVSNDPSEGATLNPNPYFETDVSSWAVAGGTFVRSTAQFHEGAASGLLTPSGVAATSQVETNPHLTGATAATVYRASAWVRCAVSRNVELRIDYYTAANAFLSSTVTTAAVTLNTWTLVQASGTSPATTGIIGVTVAMTGTPPAGNTLFIDEARVWQTGTLGALSLDVTAPKGDVETPLFLTVSSGVVGTGRRRSAFAVRRRGTPAATPFVLQAESMTLAANVTTPGADAGMSGGGSNYARISYAGTSALTQRLSTATRFPTAASTDARGTYRVFARIRRNTAADVHTIRIRWGGADVQISNATVTLPQDTGPSAPTITMVDLGLVQMPAGFDPFERGFSGTELATEGIFVAIDTGRTSGSGTLDVDYLLFLPVDDRAMFVDWPASASVTDFVVEGGASPSVYARNASGQVTSTQAPEIAGVGLMLTPNVTNRIYFHRDVGMATALTGTGDSVTATTTLTPSYFPRYVGGFRPAAT